MKTAKEYSDEIAKRLYMGTVPDIWTIMADAVIQRALQDYADERLEAAAVALKNGYDILACVEVVRGFKGK